MTGLAAAETLIEALFRTFGPFVIPAAIFLVGLVGYGVLFVLNRWFETWS